ncbi:hypothetical protein [Burkholderia latens]|uniref:Uncharacterized protein n=1 Tax=Burkholderia latens TaxID=488446 RepID=A0A6H9T159_9BURK|nr:hypothetical protein [Burkholderia latens]KAB0640514.1 hypothetical protein F7R21_16875 [Burkholderia latens]
MTSSSARGGGGYFASSTIPRAEYFKLIRIISRIRIFRRAMQNMHVRMAIRNGYASFNVIRMDD